MADKIEADLIIKAIAEGFDKARKDIDKLSDEVDGLGKSTEKSSFKWTELKSKLDLVVGAAKTVGKAFEAVFDTAREGAAITQTSESFDMLNDKLDITPGLLDRLRDASRGTISDLDLMSSTTKLLQGSSDELGKSLGEATPQLLEIAKAANKLNPSLGDTAFLYESISTGIKRASPLILDNLGLMVKVGDANEAYAKQIGKSVEALTEEEKKVALLNAVLEQGDKMIQQVGGNTESATDAFDRFTAAVDNIGDSLKKASFTALLPFISQLADLAETIFVMRQAVDMGEKSLLSMNWEMVKVAFTGKTMKDVTDELSVALDEEAKRVEALQTSESDLTNDRLATRDMIQAVKNKTEELTVATLDAAAAAKVAAEAEREFMDEVQFGVKGALSGIFDDYKTDLSDLTTEHDKLQTELDGLIQKGYKPTHDEVIKLSDAIAENEEAQQKATDAMREATKELIFQQAAAGLDAEATLILAREMGMLDDKSYALAVGLNTAKEAMQRSIETGMSATEAARLYADQVSRLNDLMGKVEDKYAKIVIDIAVNASQTAMNAFQSAFVAGGIQNKPGFNINLMKPGVGLASGGAFDVPGGHPNDTYGPIWLSSGEHVDVTSAGGTSALESQIAGLRSDLRMLFGSMQANNNISVNVNDRSTGAEFLDIVRSSL